MSISRTGSNPYIVCTSSTRPASPVAGTLIFETDTYKLLQYTTATTGWVQPWNMPWGIVGYVSSDTTQGSITTETDLTFATITATYVANRRIRFTFIARFQSTVGGDQVAIRIKEGAGLVQFQQGLYSTANTDGFPLMTTMVATPAAGSHTYKVTAARGAGTGTVSMIGGLGTQPNTYLIDDIGPNGNPA